jgi:hypothetical protein
MPTDKYETIKNLIGAKRPSWIADSTESLRVASYDVYEDMYWSIGSAFKLLERGTDNKPVYLPKPKTIVETLHRYMANSLQITIDENFGTESERQKGMLLMTDLLRRERFYSKFSNEKRFGIMRGDWAFHLLADDDLPPGSRLSIHTVQPRNLFKITSEDNTDEVVGYDVATYFEESGKGFVRRLTYMKESGTSGPSPITVEESIYESTNWGGPGMDREKAKPLQRTIPLKLLPKEIDQLPIYHIRNFEESGDAWGSSELRGFEDVLAAINQTATDEQLTLALEGLGVYVTDTGQPIDEDTDEVIPWNLGPGRVVEIDTGGRFERVTGVSSITPMLEHIAMMDRNLDEATGQPDIAKGNVEVAVAESGVALGIRFGPMISRSEEKELTVTDVLVNMFFDLRKWNRAYEGGSDIENVRFIPKYGDKIPPNKQQMFDNVILMIQSGIIDTSTGRGMLRELGYKIPDDTLVEGNILQSLDMKARVEADAISARMDRELESQLDNREQEVFRTERGEALNA